MPIDPRSPSPTDNHPEATVDGPDDGAIAAGGGLRDLLGKVTADYRRLAGSDAPKDAKQAAAFHGACRAALAHLDLLQKVVAVPRGPETGADGSGPDATVEAMIARARDVLAGHPEGDG